MISQSLSYFFCELHFIDVIVATLQNDKLNHHSQLLIGYPLALDTPRD